MALCSPLCSLSEEEKNSFQLNAKPFPLQSHSQSPDVLPSYPAVGRSLRINHPAILGLPGRIQCNPHCASTVPEMLWGWGGESKARY